MFHRTNSPGQVLVLVLYPLLLYNPRPPPGLLGLKNHANVRAITFTYLIPSLDLSFIFFILVLLLFELTELYFV